MEGRGRQAEGGWACGILPGSRAGSSLAVWHPILGEEGRWIVAQSVGSPRREGEVLIAQCVLQKCTRRPRPSTGASEQG